jgi:hypothetical protein
MEFLHRSNPRSPIGMSNTCQDPECRDVQLWMVSIVHEGERLPTDTRYDNHVPILPFSHDG